MLLITSFLVMPSAAGEVYLPRPVDDPAITVTAESAAKWREGTYEVWHLTGGCSLTQGANRIDASEAVLWIETPDPSNTDARTKIVIYAEALPTSSVVLSHRDTTGRSARQALPTWFGRWVTRSEVDWRIIQQRNAPAALPAIHARGSKQFGPSPVLEEAADGLIELAQFEQLAPAPGPAVPNPLGVRRIRFGPRSEVGMQLDAHPLPNGEWVTTITGGAHVVIEGLQAEGLPAALGSVENLDIQADRAVVWTSGSIVAGGGVEQRNDAPLEIYLEGNIIFRQADRTVYADRMYYDVRRKVGTILNAELLTPLPEVGGFQYQGLVRLKAGILEQLDASRFVAHDALLTTSRLEVPSYHLGSQTIQFEDVQQPRINPFTGSQARNPATGELEYDHASLARSQSNFLYLGNVPIFYWPTIATNLEEPSYYIDNLRIRNDRIFGFQTLVDLDVFQLFGVANPPRGVDWDLSLDYLSERGFGYGTTVEYNRDSFFDILGPTSGLFDAWAIDDNGRDNLGFGRRNILPEESYRGRVFWNHRQKFADGLLSGWTAQAEVGWISDRTFLEQYFESEWDDRKDQVTGVRLKRLRDNRSLSLEANGQINDFFTQSQWLPRLDYYVLGQELAGDSLTFYSHSNIGYANQNIASTPTNPTLASQFALLPWEQNAAGDRAAPEGERLITRNEIDLPLNFEPFKIVPFALGELGHWGADLQGNEIQRAYFQTGVRASIPFWTVNPNVQDPVFNLNGLAHKVVFDMEASYADSNRDLTEFPLYDEIDDDVFDDIRRRLFFAPCGGTLAGGQFDPTTSPTTIDPKFDPRYYLFRSGTQGWVTSPAKEVVDDLSAVRFGMRHRLQTKRGLPGRQHLVDWITLDSNVTWFPSQGRDNFGADLGLADYDFRWHLGDRFTLISDGAADFFGDGLRTVSAGMLVNRPSRGNLYLGYRTLRGPFTADVLTATVNYRLGPKWLASASAVVDFSEAGNIGQSITFSRIGESLIVSVGANIDESKDNVGFNFLVEPRFLPRLSLTRKTGIEIPPAGAFGLE
ncbi:MAG: organic solvent tolerance protein OstA [Aeoliella sp.]